jgi:serine/threonine-protein kinase HipA
MARKRTSPVWLNESCVGSLTSTGTSAVRFTYDDDILDRYPLNTPVLSCSLPTRLGTVDGRAFFAGLLPEGDHRRSLASRARILDTDVFALLSTYGQDVAGAVVIGDQIARRPRAHAAPYDEGALLADVTALAANERPLGVYDDSELSIPGIQDKMLLVRTADGGWARPVHGFPSTHILKVDDRMHRGLVIAEHTCLQIAKAAQLPAATSELLQFGDLWTLVVERFDRVAGGVADVQDRIHQEDACQALGIDLEPSQGRAKYESTSGVSLRAFADLLAAWGDRDQLLALLDQLVFTVLIGDADKHGKNISLLHPVPGQIRLAPLYDTVPTALWPNLRTQAAMSIGAVIDLPQVTGGDIVREAVRWGIGTATATERVRATVERVVAAADSIDLTDDPIASRTVALVRDHASRVSMLDR